jgi:tetratricopeptide (TPR) repeat protein
MDDTARDSARYRAFISYSHKDSRFGHRLHRRLEGYAVPRRLVGRPAAHGPVPARLAPIFRDREELSAAGNLSEQVREALAESGALIVVCSPSAVASQWVGREIELFRELHPDRPILAALIDGEPQDAFPNALRFAPDGVTPIEPLAADFRPAADGERLALLKLIAGVLGIGVDELVQRDAQRRMRRVTALTVGALAVTLAMGVTTAVALQARAEAERQRAEAEGLVQFMLTDLRDRLKGVGRLEIMTAVNQRALEHYARQDLKHLPADALERRAELLHAMGEDDEKYGRLDKAMAELTEASRTTSALLAEKPGDPKRIFAQGQSEYWVGFIKWRRGDIDGAEAGWRRYADLAAQLLAKDARNPDWQMEAGYADSNLGTLALRDRNDAATARARFQSALDHFRAAARAKPDDDDVQSSIADGWAWLADSQKALGRWDEARASREEEARLLRAAQARDPKNVTYARDLLGTELAFARIDLARGRPHEARLRLEQTYLEAGRQAAVDPSNAKLGDQKLAIGLFLAEARIADGNAASATPLVQACAGHPSADVEVRDFCALAAARRARATGTIDATAGRYMNDNKARLSKIKYSRRWGIDFASAVDSSTSPKERGAHVDRQ